MADQPKNAKLPENAAGSAREDGALGFPLADYSTAIFAPEVRPAGALGEEAVSAAEALAAESEPAGGSGDSEPSTRRTRAPKTD
jgi:hypothetical protein